MNLPPQLVQPPPRDPAGMSSVFESRMGLGLRMLAGVWTLGLVLVGLIGLRAYLKYGDFDVVVGGAIAGFVAAALSVAVVIGMVLAHGRAQRLYTHGLVTTGRVRSAQPNVSPDYPAAIEIDFVDAWGRPGLGHVAVAWSRASWLTPGVTLPVMYHPGEAGLFGALVNGIGGVLGHRKS
jgi:hypothetical protein